MITIQAFLVLHNLRKLSKNTNTEMNMLGNSTEICLGYDYDKTYDYHKYAGEITALIDSLAEENYLTYTKDNKNSFALTTKGIRTFQIFTRATVQHFLLHYRYSNCCIYHRISHYHIYHFDIVRSYLSTPNFAKRTSVVMMLEETLKKTAKVHILKRLTFSSNAFSLSFLIRITSLSLRSLFLL